MRIRPTTRRSRRILKTAVATCALAGAAAGTFFATGAGAAPPPKLKYVLPYLPAGVRCFSVTVDDDDPVVFGDFGARKPHAGPGGTTKFNYRNFDASALPHGGWFNSTFLNVPVGSTVEIVTNKAGCGHLAYSGLNHITDWTVTESSNTNVWIDTRRTEGP
ncbi:MAG: hypothetical protein JO362_23535 [Streptomycetaceae bacterium]|nr:hypothetical protein [Streptomycetaceae bacterium]